MGVREGVDVREGVGVLVADGSCPARVLVGGSSEVPVRVWLSVSENVGLGVNREVGIVWVDCGVGLTVI